MNTQPVFSPTQQPSRITQWIVGKNDFGVVDYRNLLLPTLSWHTCHNEGRWITWVASQFIDRETLENYGVNLSSLRMIVDSHSRHSSMRLLLTALGNNRSSLVIGSLPSMSAEDHHLLQQAAHEGNSQAIILLHE